MLGVDGFLQGKALRFNLCTCKVSVPRDQQPSGTLSAPDLS